MKKILYVIFVVSLLASTGFSQTAKDLLKQAVSFYTQGEYTKALDILDKIDSPDINTEPLRKEIQKKLGIKEPEKETQKKSEANTKSNQELFNQAASLYNQGKYEEALQILKDISDPNINTQPLITEINKKIKAKTKEDESKNKIADDLSKSEISKRNEDKKEVTSIGVNKTTRVNKLEENKISKNENLQKEEDAVELTYLDMPNNNKKTESSTITEDKTSESYLNNKETADFFTNKYLFGAILFLALVVIGFVMIKNKTNKNQRTLQLIGLSSNNNYTFNKREIKIGRAHDNDFVINYDGISRYHAIIRYDKQSNRFLVKDLNSTNGTLINSKKISVAELKNGDEINFYKMNYKVKL